MNDCIIYILEFDRLPVDNSLQVSRRESPGLTGKNSIATSCALQAFGRTFGVMLFSPAPRRGAHQHR
jgi:hypothetical protein